MESGLPSWRKALSLALPLCIPFLLWSCTPALRAPSQAEGGVPVLFTLVSPMAQTVCIVGSFNGWSRSTHCMSQSEGQWSLRVVLPPGRYAYAFLIDGKASQEDPGAVLAEESGFGMRNSVLILE